SLPVFIARFVAVRPHRQLVFLASSLLTVVLSPSMASAQSSGGNQGGSSQDDPTLRFLMPTVTVTAQKEPEDKQRVPISVTAAPEDLINSAGIHIVSDAQLFAPNT